MQRAGVSLDFVDTLFRAVIAEDPFDAALSECRAHLRKSDTIFTMCTVAQVWGRKPH